MVMKEVIKPDRGPRRLSVSEAKAKLSEALNRVHEGPTVIHNRGRDIAVLIGIDDYDGLVGERRASAGREFLTTVSELKRRLGGGAEFSTPRARLHAVDPFAPQRKARR
jgi:prevent-host-death family protein